MTLRAAERSFVCCEGGEPRAQASSVRLRLTVLLIAGSAGFGTPIRILFVHHSTGANLVREGGVREDLSALDYWFCDHGYNEDGLTDARGHPTGTNFAVPDDSADPDGWAAIFAEPVTVPLRRTH